MRSGSHNEVVDPHNEMAGPGTRGVSDSEAWTDIFADRFALLLPLTSHTLTPTVMPEPKLTWSTRLPLPTLLTLPSPSFPYLPHVDANLDAGPHADLKHLISPPHSAHGLDETESVPAYVGGEGGGGGWA